jgi:hypothetical protein
LAKVFMVYAFMLFGVVGLIVGALGARAAHLRIRALKLSWWRVQIAPMLCSAVLSVPLSLIGYPVSDTATIVGIPFPVAAFIDHFDYVGPATIPMFIANLLFCLLVPQPVLASFLRARCRRQNSC